MKQVLHLLTQPVDPLAKEVLNAPGSVDEGRPEVCDLTVPAPDYDAILEAVLRAGVVVVW
jgi:hypothetical protein